MKKKLLSVLVAAVLGCSLFAAVPVVSQAEETTEYTSGDWTYVFEYYVGDYGNEKCTLEGGCAIVGYSGSDTDIIIPSTLDGNTVVGIGEFSTSYRAYNRDYQVFMNNEDITSVIIPDTVKFIGPACFAGCKGLKDVDLGNSVSFLGNNCFSSCNSLTSIELPASMTASDARAAYPFQFSESLKTVTIESGGVGIPATLFFCCYGLEKITIPEGITTIGRNAFGQSALKEITLPDSLQDIEYDAFEATNLTEMVLPKGIHSVSYRAFNNCKSLKDFYDYNEYTEYIDETDSYGKVWTVFLSSPVTIHGYPGSNAEAYAAKHDIPFVPLSGDNPETPAVEGSMYRLYNPNSGEHFYTSDANEKNYLVSLGWGSEGVAWIAPASSNTPVYRVYNPNSGEHHYTTDEIEKDYLISLGWNNEGIGWYSDDSQGTPLYRLYNPNAKGQYEAGGHHYTKDINERDSLVADGWEAEGIGWYGK